MEAIQIKLKENEVKFLKEFKKKGMRNAREIMRANVLLSANNGEKPKEISEKLDVHRNTIMQIKKKYLEGDLERALNDNHRSGKPKKYSDKQEAEIVALACTDPPKGRKRWTIRLIAETLKGKKGFETLSRETVRLVLKKRTLKPLD
ncbi:MAG: helix-turn-helix domain-containing protein [Methanobrevibacter sp.]|jgi:transposase|nr:helix-turn-helix domain-containing protein [Candidatus Methanovirga australis]